MLRYPEHNTTGCCSKCYNIIRPKTTNAESANNTQCKKDGGVSLQAHLEPRSKSGEDKKTIMPEDTDIHAETYNKQNTSSGGKDE